ncbi:hypothetical protein [Yoonia sp. I 8.24]|uniref:hypothetical protein n=1 Tax=Yoonia sp. I 8.24 TaxID=1537229 RepID=UPI001EE027D1|nr:hypothetical protein [Yoonia sp. I 8.24]MCG3267379.1 hypothetical protein [Yoonia sp. I 8.24]
MSLSALVWAGDQVIACLTVIVIASAMSFEKMLKEYAADLKETAAKISAGIAALPDDRDARGLPET